LDDAESTSSKSNEKIINSEFANTQR
jgi:hypothetical protein